MTEDTRPAGELALATPARGWRAAFPPAQWLAHAIAGVTLAA